MVAVITLSPTFAQVPIDDHFDTAMGPGWVVIRGGAYVDNGWLVLNRTDSVSPRDSVVAINDGDISIKDFVLHVRVDPVPSGPGNIWNRAGIGFRTTDAFGALPSQYSLYFVLPPDGSGTSRVHLSRAVNGVGVEIGQVNPFTATEPMDVVVSAIGHSIKVYVNGSIVFDVNDPEGPLAGGVALWNVWESMGRYDDVILAQVPPEFCPGDADGNRSVEFADITTVLSNWLSTCP